MTDPEREEYPAGGSGAGSVREPERADLPPLEPSQEDRYPFWNYQDVFLLAAVALPMMVVSFVLVAGLFQAGGWPIPRPVQILTGQFLFYTLWFLLLYAWLKMRYQRPFWEAMAWRLPAGGLVPSAAWGVGTAVTVILLGALLRPPEMKLPLMEMFSDPVSLVLVGTFAVTIGPLAEELAFRGLLLPLVARSLGWIPGILLTALLFASLHGPEYAWSWRHLLLITFAGAAFGWMRRRSGSTATATVMHAAYNFVFFLGMLAQRDQLAG